MGVVSPGARQEADGTFAEKCDKACEPFNIKEESLSTIAAGKTPISVQSEETWKTICRRMNEVNFSKSSSDEGAAKQAAGRWKATSKLIISGLVAGTVSTAEFNMFLGRAKRGMLEEWRLYRILECNREVLGSGKQGQQ
jgi:hypothetical protein